MKRMKKCGILFLCMAMLAAPIGVQADTASVDLEQIETDVKEIMGDVEFSELLDNRDVLVDVVIYVCDYIKEHDFDKDDIEDLVEDIAEALGYELGDTEEEILASLVEKYCDPDMTEEQIRKELETAASIMSLTGLDLEDAEGIANFAIGFFKGIKG